MSLSVLMLAAQTVVTITLPSEGALLKPGPGAEDANAFCLACHSADYVETQPPLGREFWQATVTKMQKVYGAPIPDDKATSIVDYLTRAYGP